MLQVVVGRDSTKAKTGLILLELLSILAALVIVLGLMVSLARYVRQTSASDLTKDLLRRLDEAMKQYIDLRNGGLPPALPPLIVPDAQPSLTATAPPRQPNEASLTLRAEANSRATVHLLRQYHVFPDDAFADLSISYYNGSVVRDAWGSAIVFMPQMDPAIGMAAQGWFFFSAGPDRRYTTKTDNVYSYELMGPQR